ncbi:branched-chain amino acid ABC transporter permease [Dictyobacter arantiisoli]|uniref:Branched-chain amino acid ABC transporter permease n=1 Tax=Dictyobacter arantiisoli TaxID=2014874 RepID=A0A5A5TJB5_9CHLR|nr:branched-chain amino acid ABC transporter permease [Dictyobacter arantiisoli]GCF11318.1 branched-chain amino acid ABC transporter permease [Dictyobacter arantiisoli]
MALLTEAIILGLLTGSVYALMASGLTLIFGVMDIINVAQGIFVVLGAYLSYILEQHLHIDLFLGLFITMPFMFFLGIGIEWAFIRRIRQNRVMLSLLVTYAISLVIEGLLNFFFTASTVRLNASYVDASFPVFGFYISYMYLFTAVMSIALLAALYFVIYRTRFGYSMRAAMQNRTAAMLIGINVERVSGITFGLGVALTAAGGMAFGATNAFNAASSYDLISRLLVIIVLGGMGSLRGSMVASLFMLVIGAVTDVLWSPVWSSTVFFVLLVILLIFRPQGLFGKVEGRKQ